MAISAELPIVKISAAVEVKKTFPLSKNTAGPNNFKPAARPRRQTI